MKKWSKMLSVFLVMVLVLTTAFSAGIQASNVMAASHSESGVKKKSKVLIAYFGRYGNTNFKKNVDATTSASIVKDGKKKQGTTEMRKLAFVNGDITYCFENDTMAVFYNQSDEPDLTMRVNCIGRVTSDLSVFKEMGDSVTMTFDLKE